MIADALDTPLTEFRVTFGLQYERVPHPSFAAAHPDGWLSIVAADEDEARSIAVAELGREWAFLYCVATADPAMWAKFPRGQLATVGAPA